MAREHTLKCNVDYWEAVANGEKNFEVRRDDRGFQNGDTLILQKWEPPVGWWEDQSVADLVKDVPDPTEEQIASGTDENRR